MSQENQITLRGYLTAEPKFYQRTPQAVPLTEIRVGCTPRRLNRETGEWQDLPTSYYRVKCWRRLAINTVSSLHKGDMVVVRGHFYMNSWVDNQQRPRSTLEIEADTIGHDLAYGWSHYIRSARSSASRADVNAGEAARQDTGAETPGSGDGGDEDIPGPEAPDLEAAGPDEPAEAAPPGGQPRPWVPSQPEAGAPEAGAPEAGTGESAWHPGARGDFPAGPGAGRDAADDGGGREPDDTAAAPDGAAVTGSLEEDLNSLEPEAVPF